MIRSTLTRKPKSNVTKFLRPDEDVKLSADWEAPQGLVRREEREEKKERERERKYLSCPGVIPSPRNFWKLSTATSL